ncbi:hypothetical protein R1sor_017891 [Riccia sorocarpa]|uniref:Uncharacterized protein n=1 Tax=Riccia sorocarpa TaxID=122646 RepID=A0ABD3IBF0_9MARC
MIRNPNSLLASSATRGRNPEIQVGTISLRLILHPTSRLGELRRFLTRFQGTNGQSAYTTLVSPLTAPDLWKFCGTKVGQFQYKTRASNLEAATTILEGDVVEYTDSFEAAEVVGSCRQKKLGVVLTVELNAHGFCDLEPLRQDEPGSNEWVGDEGQPQVRVPLSQVRVIEAWPSQRMDSDRVSNPHGEHAHSVWLIDPAS